MSKPKFRPERVFYEREEKEGYWTFIPRYHPETRELIINATSREIAGLCDGTRTMDEIERVMGGRYPQVKKEQINVDVARTVASLSRFGMIEWQGDNPFLYRRAEPIDEEYSLVIGQEDDIHRIGMFLKKHKILESKTELPEDYLSYISPVLNPNEYDELALRQKLFSYAEEYFLLVKGSEIVGLVAIEPPILVHLSLAASIKLVIAPAKHAVRLLEYAETAFPYLAVREVVKLKVYERAKAPLSVQVRELLVGVDYQDGVVLTSELGFGDDLKVWSLVYDQAFINSVKEQKGGNHG